MDGFIFRTKILEVYHFIFITENKIQLNLCLIKTFQLNQVLNK